MDPDPAFTAALTASCNAWATFTEPPSPPSLTLDGASSSISPMVLATPALPSRRRRGPAARNPFATPALTAHILQIYRRTDGSYMGSPEMSPLYGVVNALAQTAAAIILLLRLNPLLPSPSPPDQSLLLLFPRIRSHFCVRVTAVRHFRTPTRSSDSLPFV